MRGNAIYSGKRVFVTGHTGFKGSWLCEWLLALGAEVHGYALEPSTDSSLFDQLGLAGRIASHAIGDIRDREGHSRLSGSPTVSRSRRSTRT